MSGKHGVVSSKKNIKKRPKSVPNKKKMKKRPEEYGNKYNSKMKKKKPINKRIAKKKQYVEDNIERTPRNNNEFYDDGMNNMKKKRKKKRSKVRIAIRIMLIVLLIIFIGRWWENGFTYGGLLATFMGHSHSTVDKMETINMVITGESQGLTDSIMLCQYNPKENKARIISIPRDTFIGDNINRASPSDKINTLYKRDPQMLLSRVSKITGVNVKYYMNIDIKSLRALVDEVGGVYFDVPIDMDYDDDTQNLHIHLKAGYQLLDGDKAEQVVRFRHNNDGSSYPYEYGDNDLGRMKTQRAFISTLAEQILSKKSVSKINKYTDIFKENVTTNANFKDVANYIPYMVDFKMENLETQTLPGQPKLCNGVWLYVQDDDEVEELMNEFN